MVAVRISWSGVFSSPVVCWMVLMLLIVRVRTPTPKGCRAASVAPLVGIRPPAGMLHRFGWVRILRNCSVLGWCFLMWALRRICWPGWKSLGVAARGAQLVLVVCVIGFCLSVVVVGPTISVPHLFPWCCSRDKGACFVFPGCDMVRPKQGVSRSTNVAGLAHFFHERTQWV